MELRPVGSVQRLAPQGPTEAFWTPAATRMQSLP